MRGYILPSHKNFKCTRKVIMGFFKNTEKETIKILIDENKRLKRENQRLNESLGELQRYKDEYRNLIDELNQVKAVYASKMNEFDRLEKEYRNEFKRIKKQQSIRR